jgi:Fic family protein
VYVAAPPDIRLGSLAGNRFEKVMRLLGENLRADSDYLHWDKLRHLPPPEGFSREEWWLAITIHRAPLRRELPLRDPAGKAFSYATPDSVLRLLHFVDQHCAGEVAMGELVAGDEQAREHYLVNSLMEEAIRSSQLEGATTSRRVAKEMLRTGRAPVDRSEQMILNNYRALEFMREQIGAVLTPESVLELHRVLTEGTLDDPSGAGRLQTPDEERVAVMEANDGSVIHTPPPAEQLPERMRALCDFANQRGDDSASFIHPVVRAILLHFWLAYDHPFVDGNGRTARALFYWHMRTRGYWLAEYLSISRILREAPSKYAHAFLFTETDGGDTTYFLLHQLQTIERAVKQLGAYLDRKVREIRRVERMLVGADGLNHRQIALLSDALRHPEDTYSYQGHATNHRVTHETARHDLLDLQGRGLLVRRKTGRRHTFAAVPDLAGALAAPNANSK